MIPHIAAKALNLFAHRDAWRFRPYMGLPALRIFPCAQWWEATDGHSLIRLSLVREHWEADLAPGTYQPADAEMWALYANTPKKWRTPHLGHGPLAPVTEWPDTDFVWPPEQAEAAKRWGIAPRYLARLASLAAIVGPRNLSSPASVYAVSPNREALGVGMWRPALDRDGRNACGIIACEVLVMPMRIDDDRHLDRTDWARMAAAK